MWFTTGIADGEDQKHGHQRGRSSQKPMIGGQRMQRAAGVRHQALRFGTPDEKTGEDEAASARK